MPHHRTIPTIPNTGQQPKLPPGTPLCGAMCRQTGAPCKMPAMRDGNGRCWHHGGRRAVISGGSNNGNFKHGRYSKVIASTKLRERYEDALADPELISLRDGIAIIDARLGELIETIGNRGAGPGLNKASELLDDIEEALQTGDQQAAKAMLEPARHAIAAAASEYSVWREIRQTFQDRRKLVDTEHKRLVAAQQMITAEQGMSLVTALGMLVREHVKDREALRIIQAGINRLTGQADRQLIEAHATYVDGQPAR